MFSLSYARGNYREFFRQWRWALIGAVVLPVLLAAVSPRALLLTAWEHNPAAWVWIFRLGPAGMALYGVFLFSVVFVLINLERTFRTAVGTMRWRIKFMILGLAVLFCARAYTSSQALLWRDRDPSLMEINCGALALGCLLMLRSLFRDVSEVAVFPSKAILANSLTALVAGAYLVCVGVLVKLAALIETVQGQGLPLPAGLGRVDHRGAFGPGAPAHAAVYQPLFSAPLL